MGGDPSSHPLCDTRHRKVSGDHAAEKQFAPRFTTQKQTQHLRPEIVSTFLRTLAFMAPRLNEQFVSAMLLNRLSKAKSIKLMINNKHIQSKEHHMTIMSENC